MTEVGSVYGQALYDLAREEKLDKQILGEITALNESFQQEPDFLRLLASPNLPKQERCALADSTLRGSVQPYVLNFIKILTERGYAKQFSNCVQAYRDHYNQHIRLNAAPEGIVHQSAALLLGKIGGS